ncbi:30S ribosomal protein S9 [Candidatus Vidania fulgoroideorum]
MIGVNFFSKCKKKTSTAKVIIRKNNRLRIIINGKNINCFSKNKIFIENIMKPFIFINKINFFIKIIINGGGEISKSISIRNAISKCICEMYPKFKKIFKKEGLTKNDTRTVERKKIGLIKSRKKRQYSKR